MKQKRKSPGAVKFIACLLLLGSLAMLLLPWLKLAVDTREGRMDLQELLSLAGESRESILESAGQSLADAGIPVPGERVRPLLSALLDGRYSLPTLARLCGQGSELGAAIGQADAAQTLSTAGLVVWILLGLLALLGLIGLCCVFTDHRGGILPYLLLSILAVAGVILLRAEANRVLEQQGTALLDGWGVAFLVNYFGIDLNIVKMGIAAYLCPFLALLALLLMGIKKKRPAPARREPATPYPARKSTGSAPVAVRAPAAPAGWTCPNCGSVRAEEESFCTVCGARKSQRPAAKLCPCCGRRLPPDAAFCSDCGTKL